MRKSLTVMLAILINTVVLAQTPTGFSYQAVVRNSSGQTLANQSATIKVSLTNSEGSTVYYSETHAITTTAQGLAVFIIGNGQNKTGSLTTTPWSGHSIYISIELKLSGSNTFTFMGRQQLQAVPYALFAADGIGIQWLGALIAAPTTPAKNQAYYNSTEKKSYIWDGDSWEILAMDGPQGPAGTGLNLRGGWSSAASYAGGDYVFDESSSIVGDNSMWICQLAVGPSALHPKNDLEHWVEFEAPAGPQGIPGLNGVSIQWLGSLGSTPGSPLLNQAYYSIIDKKSYIWDGDTWEILSRDGETGPSGMDIPGIEGQLLMYNGTEWVATGKISVNADTLGVGTNTPISKMVVKGDATALPEDPIFEVKNKDGKVVFGVYNEGVRVYVADGAIKGARGGFAVGGLSTQGKAGAAEYFRITPDSARIYIDTSSAKGAKGGFAVGGLSTQGKADMYELFRVTKDSTRIYVSDKSSKGARGGFAVGGLSTQGKNSRYDLFRVSKDSTRIYIDDLGKGARGGFAVGGLSTQGKGVGVNFFDVATDASGTILQSKNKVLWYPLKNAFLAGKVIIESPDSVGENSFATGYESKSIGMYSQAMGFQAIAKGNYSTAIGKNAIASANNSFAFGDSAFALKDNSFAIGSKAKANGIGSYALGAVMEIPGYGAYTTEAIGDYSFACGLGALAIGNQSVSLGSANQAIGLASIAIGGGNYSRNPGSICIGDSNIASKDYATAIGTKCIADGEQSFAIGNGSESYGFRSISLSGISSGISSIAIGGDSEGNGSISLGGYAKGTNSMSLQGSVSNGYNSFALGLSSETFGERSLAIGNVAVSTGSFSLAIGNNVTSQSFSSTVMGSYNIIGGYHTIWVDTDPIFVVGNGSSGLSRSNAMTILKNGNIGVGTTTPGFRLDVVGDIRSSSKIWASANGSSYFRGGDDAELWDVNVANTLGVYGVQNSAVATIRLGSGAADISGYSGRVGIGTTFPSYKLHTVGDIYADGGWLRVSGNQGLYFESWGGGWYMSDNDWIRACNNKNIYTTGIIRTDGSLNVAGNAGIGTYAPAYKLDVVGRSRFQSGGGASAGFWLTNAANSLDRAFIGMLDDNYVGMYGSAGANWSIKMNVVNGYTGFGLPQASAPRSIVEISGAATFSNMYSEPQAPGTTDASGDKIVIYEDASKRSAIGMSSTGIYIQNTGTSISDGIRFITGFPATTETMRLCENGNLGIGTTSPSYKLDVSGIGRFTSNLLIGGNVGIGSTNPANRLHISQAVDNFLMYIENTGNTASSNGIKVKAGNISGGLGGGMFMQFLNNSGTDIGSIDQNITYNGVIYGTSSDRRLKENIKPTKYSLDDLMRVNVRDFNYLEDVSKTEVSGFIAQELFEIYPEAVTKPESEEKIWKVDYGRITPLLVKAIQDQQVKIQTLEQRNSELETKIKEIDILKAELDTIKKLISK